MKIFRSAYEEDVESIYSTGFDLVVGVGGGARDTHLATRLFRRGAELGHVPSMLALARSYNLGIGVVKYPAKAARIYCQIAEKMKDEQELAA